ncbi:MAG TPA: Ohr family peroxiredoxin [Chitinophagaceae bacterium]|nr:Ohr family peroxiredoxin [Chitinophagaceae bacterium]
METFYSTKVTATSGRHGYVVSDDNALNAEVQMPREMGGTGGDVLNPETLFAGGFAAAFNNSLNAIISREKVETGTTNTTAKVAVFQYGDGYQFAVQLEVLIPGVDHERAEDLLKKSSPGMRLFLCNKRKHRS